MKDLSAATARHPVSFMMLHPTDWASSMQLVLLVTILLAAWDEAGLIML